jgi:hypothetical protein
LDELKKAARELDGDTTGSGSNGHDFPLLPKELAGLKLKLVLPSNSDVLLAIERNRVDSSSALTTTIQLAANLISIK